MIRKITILCLFTLLWGPVTAVHAQEEPEYPTYVVQPGDTLYLIAVRFGVSLDEIIEVNEIIEPNDISSGVEIKIPGLVGINGKLVIRTTLLGENIQTISTKYQIPIGLITQLNRIVSQDEIYVGTDLVIPERAALFGPSNMIKGGQSLLEIAILQNDNPWSLVEGNMRKGTWDSIPDEMIYAQSADEKEIAAFSPLIKELSINPLPIVQGRTVEVRVISNDPLELSGSLAGYPLVFFPVAENDYVAFQGIHARQETGVAQVSINGNSASGDGFGFEQYLLIDSGYYGQDLPITVDPITIQPEIIEPEQELIESITGLVTLTRYWSGKFLYPVDEPCIGAGYGGSRIYNGTYHYYHTGIDFSVCTANNLYIYSAAPGYVVFSGSLVIWGNAILIDHGWGVYSGYLHQSELMVNEGDFVEAGQILGLIGNTGRSTGAHLHFEVWVHGVQVNPLDWLMREYPDPIYEPE